MLAHQSRRVATYRCELAGARERYERRRICQLRRLGLIERIGVVKTRDSGSREAGKGFLMGGTN